MEQVFILRPPLLCR